MCRKMLITLCYMYLWLRFQRYYTSVIRSALYRLSADHRSVTFCALNTPKRSREDQLFLQLRNNVMYISQPQVICHSAETHRFSQSTHALTEASVCVQACDDLSEWTLLVGSSLARARRLENITFIIEATSGQKACASAASAHEKVLKWSDYCLPLAHSPGQPYRAVAESSVENCCRLAVAFMEDRLLMENGLIPERIVSVLLRESTLRELQQSHSSRKSESAAAQPRPDVLYSTLPRKSSLRLSARRDSDAQSCKEERQEEPERTSEHRHGEGHLLHLSSCHECRELENSTILSVKFASVEDIPDLPDDYAAADGEEEESEGFSGRSGRVNASGKPPNVLVFTGGCEEQFQRVRSLLAECVDTESYAIYHLPPQQALSEPWPENVLLLVLATDRNLTPQLQLRFLSYLSQGGKVLGLSSTLCPAGLALRPRDTQKDLICTLTFTKSDSTELRLSVLCSGGTYVREPQDGGAGEVELWGEIDEREEKHMAIVRVTHGADSGEAVLCQVRLEVAPDAHLASGFSELKMSNARRYEVLTEILTSLGLSCELTQEQRDRFLHWLQRQVDGSGGVLHTRVGGFRVFRAGERAADLGLGERELHTDPPHDFSKLFSLQTYQHNLQTRRLGQTVLYADVTSSTMDLLESLILKLPEEMGLIAIAARQTQGKGRGGNVWLSPMGCAMFTLHLQIPLKSQLGQRVSFLQHLVALAVVESVRTLPGYEDIDLRLKWPNDIYYSNLMKLGGVLVNSSITGQTFNLLIGCGFNVSNSNPTVCINDLVLQHGCSLDALAPAQLIARTLTLLERFIADFQLHGPHALLPLYYKRWVHSGTRVRLWSEDGPEADVVGLDENGFLQVLSGDQRLVSVQPDGNSFDMLRNLVVTKSS
ncbi:biotin--protein ligase isoform X3 [Triplophysa rosa]|uniref:biotin--protein ligase isoform X3 n=1 Tax=Triplophysa rosa TaxID=992332 RepID=UPI002545D0A6|nr:biotin--protein ligase isoform X3 [Triplophysa rosa]